MARRPSAPAAPPAPPAGPEGAAPPAAKPDPPPSELGWKKPKDRWLSVRNEALWRRLW